jgi:hypothetical protein
MPCDVMLLLNTLTLESSTSTPRNWSLFTLVMCFPPIQTSADIWQTQEHAAPSGSALKCLGPTGYALPTLIPLLVAITHSLIRPFPKISYLMRLHVSCMQACKSETS